MEEDGVEFSRGESEIGVLGSDLFLGIRETTHPSLETGYSINCKKQV